MSLETGQGGPTAEGFGAGTVTPAITDPKGRGILPCPADPEKRLEEFLDRISDHLDSAIRQTYDARNRMTGLVPEEAR